MKLVKYLIYFTFLLIFCALLSPSGAHATETPPDTSKAGETQNALSPPTFEISPLSFTYDGKAHALKVENLSHEYSEEGFFTFCWYKDGILLQTSASTIQLKNVRDHGVYCVDVSFTYQGETVTVRSEEVEVSILPLSVTPPQIQPKVYDGNRLYASVSQSPYYKVEENKGGADAGKYPVILALTDSENTVWEEKGDDVRYHAEFEIVKAKNSWIEEPYVLDTYLGSAPIYGGFSKFGTPKLTCSTTAQGPFSLVLPGSTGTVYARVEVDGCQNYTSLTSSVFEISVRENTPVSIRIDAPPDKTVYTAFDEVDLTGIRVSITHLDGAVTLADIRSLRVIYDTYPNALCAKDSGVTVTYGAFKARLGLTVKKATYPLDALDFHSDTLTYCGEYLTLPVGKDAIEGKDGVPLRMQLKGGGVDVGVYEVTLSFFTESENYETPPSRVATLTILPKSVRLSWEMLTFVYDSTEKTPSATFINVFGNTEHIVVDGGRVDAGEDYVATARTHPNYSFENPTERFTIQKGEYDMSNTHWSADVFVYDGTEKSPHLTGLPEGVSVSEYQGNRATDFGEYRASVTLAYDTKNYNAPSVSPLSWTIAKATYDLSGFEILGGVFLFDGKLHTPTVIGVLPLGADGIRLSLAFSDGVTHVDEGRKDVTCVFSTTSENYLTPPPMTVTVAIAPAPVQVVWKNLTFTYDGTTHTPDAVSEEVEVCVSGGMVCAGEYVASASTLNHDYYITNPKCAYVIQKAKNEWIVPLSVKDTYTSLPPSPMAGAKYGEVTFTYYAQDGAEVKNPREKPGRYTCIASVEESDNYTHLISNEVPFFVYAVELVGMQAKLNRDNLYAYESLSTDDITVTLLYNDGSQTDLSTFDIVYENGQSLRAKDTSLRILTPEGELLLPVEVAKAKFDKSLVSFSFSEISYHPNGHTLRVTSLPEGVSLLSLSQTTFLDVGVYDVVATFSIDEENYEGNPTFTHQVTVKKQILTPPHLPSLTYSATPQKPTVTEHPQYEVSFVEEGYLPGEYQVVLTLKDDKNTAFEGTDENTLSLYYTIQKAKLTLTLSDITIYRDGGKSDFSYYISEGTLFPTDTLTVTPEIGETVNALVSHDCYEVTVLEGKILYSERNTPTQNQTAYFIIGALVLFVLVLLLLVYFHRDKKSTPTTEPPTDPTPEHTPPIIPTPEHTPPTASTAEHTPTTDLTSVHTPPSAPTPEHTPTSLNATHPHTSCETTTSASAPQQFVATPPTAEADFCPTENAEVQTPEMTESPHTSENCDTLGEATLVVETVECEEECPISDVISTVEYESEQEGATTYPLSGTPSLIEEIATEEVTVADARTTMPTDEGPEVECVSSSVLAEREQTVTTLPTGQGRSRERKKGKGKNESALTRFFEFIFAPWHKNAGRRAERIVAHSRSANEEFPFRQSIHEPQDYFGITQEEADRLLSDRSAEALLEYRNAPIVTTGKRRAIINIDTLCEHFASGERVDIEILKARSLIPYDTLHLKVLARGTINKPLYVFANDFSLCAIKMLLLSGGKAVKQKTKSVGFSMDVKRKKKKS